jgi:hypothetical protein
MRSHDRNAPATANRGGAEKTNLAGLQADYSTPLATRINEHHRQAYGHAAKAIEHARQAGELLIQAKSEIPHGGWLPWLKANCDVSEREAQRYMRLASRWHELKSDTVSDLSLRGALEAMTDHRTPASDRGRWLDTMIQHLNEFAALEQQVRAAQAEIDDVEARLGGLNGESVQPLLERLAAISNNPLEQKIAVLRIRMQRHLGEAFLGCMTLADALDAPADAMAGAGFPPGITVKQFLMSGAP